MFGLGFGEVLVILVVALLVFGPERLPEFARTLGKTMAELRRAMDEVRTEFRGPAQDFERSLRHEPPPTAPGMHPNRLPSETGIPVDPNQPPAIVQAPNAHGAIAEPPKPTEPSTPASAAEIVAPPTVPSDPEKH